MKTWTDQEIEVLRKYYAMTPPDIMGAAKELNKSYDVIRNKASREGLSANNFLREEEYTYIKENYHKKQISVMAREMGRNRLTVKKMLRRLGLKSVYTIVHNKWEPKPEEIEILKSGKLLVELSKILHKSYSTLRNVMRIHGIIPAKMQRAKRVEGPRKKYVKRNVVTGPSVPRTLSDGENRIKESMRRLGYL